MNQHTCSSLASLFAMDRSSSIHNLNENYSFTPDSILSPPPRSTNKGTLNRGETYWSRSLYGCSPCLRGNGLRAVFRSLCSCAGRRLRTQTLGRQRSFRSWLVFVWWRVLNEMKYRLNWWFEKMEGWQDDFGVKTRHLYPRIYGGALAWWWRHRGAFLFRNSKLN